MEMDANDWYGWIYGYMSKGWSIMKRLMYRCVHQRWGGSDAIKQMYICTDTDGGQIIINNRKLRVSSNHNNKSTTI